MAGLGAAWNGQVSEGFRGGGLQFGPIFCWFLVWSRDFSRVSFGTWEFLGSA